MRRLTKHEWHAVADALNQVLAGPGVDGYDEGSEEEERVHRAMETAVAKVWDRLD